MTSFSERLLGIARNRLSSVYTGRLEVGSSSHQFTRCREDRSGADVVITWVEDGRQNALLGIMHYAHDKNSQLIEVDPYNPTFEELQQKAGQIQRDFCERNCQNGCLRRRRRSF